MEGYSDSTVICNNPTPIVTSSRATTIDTESIDTNATPQTPLIQSEGQTYSLPRLIYSSICESSFMNQIVPIFTSTISGCHC